MKILAISFFTLFITLTLIFLNVVSGCVMGIWVDLALYIAFLIVGLFVIMSVRSIIKIARKNMPGVDLAYLMESGEFERTADGLYISMRYWNWKEKIKFFFGLCGN